MARIGGDEFVALVTDVPDQRVVMDLAHRLLRTLRQPMVIDGRELRVSGSIGVAIYPDDGVDYDLLLRKADAAMYGAKEDGGGGARLHVQADSDGGSDRALTGPDAGGESGRDGEPRIPVPAAS